MASLFSRFHSSPSLFLTSPINPASQACDTLIPRRLASDTRLAGRVTFVGFLPVMERDGRFMRKIYAHEPCLSTEPVQRSEEHTSELQSLMRISYAVFCLKKKTKQTTNN